MFVSTVKSKATQRPFSKESTTEYKTYSDKVVSNLWGPAKVMSLGGNKYANMYLDAHTREERAYYLPSKSNTFAAYKKYEAWVRVLCGTPIKIFGCDCGGEFMSREFMEHLENSGMVRHLTVHDSPASNGVVERANRTLIEGTCALLHTSGLPQYLWAEAHHHFIWLRNCSPTRALPEHKTPLEIATGKKPDLSLLQEFGATAWVRRLNTGKLESRCNEG